MELLALTRHRLTTSSLAPRLLQKVFNRSIPHLQTQQTSLYHHLRPNHQPRPLLRRLRTPCRPQRRHNSSKSSEPSPNVTPNLGSPQPATTLSARLKQLSREYGWTALGVYLGLSAIDFPFCYLAVRLLGTERIGYAEHVVVTGFWSLVGLVVPSMKPSERQLAGETEAQVREGAKHTDVSKDNASLWTQLVLAYAVHKSLIVFRVPLTAAVLPKVVKTMRSWGWNVGRKMPKVTKPGNKPSE
ncbi:hypothetical protein MBLNU457_3770t1 [Dothideomycetes sp. NU457]